MNFNVSDLTVIIPTISTRVSLLTDLLDTLNNTSIRNVLIVWDSSDPQPNFTTRNFDLKVVCHDKNRGLSAARNTGILHLQTKLGMFIDDDIQPNPEFVQQIVAFHNAHPSEMVTSLSKVTWTGTGYENALTDWYEEFGNWSVFNTTSEGSIMPTFAGGFTSFKSDTFKQIQFNESFTQYGCEDIEFGHRFFQMGGQQLYLPQVVGKHYKHLSTNQYISDATGSGYSNYVYFKLWPNDYHCINTMKAALSTEITINDCRPMVEQLTKIENIRENAPLLAPIIGYLGNASDITGFRKGIISDYPEITIQPTQPLIKNLESIITSIPHCAPAMLILSLEYPSHPLILEHWKKHKEQWSVLRAILLEQHEHVKNINNIIQAATNIFDTATTKVKSDIACVFSDINTNYQTIIPQKISQYKARVRADHFDMRENHALMQLALSSGDNERACDLAIDTLSNQIDHVSSWIVLANFTSVSNLRKFFTNRARFYLRYRPRSEQIKREAEINQLEGQLINEK